MQVSITTTISQMARQVVKDIFEGTQLPLMNHILDTDKVRPPHEQQILLTEFWFF